MKKLNLEIELTDNTLDNIIKMAPYLDEKSQDRVFGMMLEAVKSLEKEQKAGQENTLTLGEVLKAAEDFSYIRIKVKKMWFDV